MAFFNMYFVIFFVQFVYASFFFFKIFCFFLGR